MKYLFSIQIDNEVMLYITKNVIGNSDFPDKTRYILYEYMGDFSAYDSDDNHVLDLSVSLKKEINVRDISYLEIGQNDINVNIKSLQEQSIILNENTVEDQVKYWIFEKIKIKIEQSFDGVESDDIRENENENENDLDPYNPELIRVDPKQMSVSYIHDLINEYDSLELSADFQRNFIWTDAKRKSRLIESILLRIPLPAFYFSTDESGNYQIVDGLQRVNVINMYINGEFKLTDLEYLDECAQCFFSMKYDKSKSKSKRKYLNPKYVRRILETQLSINVIDPQTPSMVKYDIFKRLNTGGKPLNNMEIRNSFASQRIRKYLRSFTKLKEYKESSLSSINSTRFADLELVLRFIGFYLGVIESNERFVYRGKMENHLDDVIEYLKNTSDSELAFIKHEYTKMLKMCNEIFGKYAFRKAFTNITRGTFRMPAINKSLFTATSISCLRYYNQLLEVKSFNCKENVEKLATVIELKYHFFESLSFGTNDKDRIFAVINYMNTYFEELLEDYDDRSN